MKEQTEELKLIYQINHSYYPNIDSFISKVIDFVEVYYRTKENTIISDFLFNQFEMNEIIIGDIVNKFEMKEVMYFILYLCAFKLAPWLWLYQDLFPT